MTVFTPPIRTTADKIKYMSNIFGCSANQQSFIKISVYGFVLLLELVGILIVLFCSICPCRFRSSTVFKKFILEIKHVRIS